ncbi:MAG TPA: LPS assembly lipoprotein LptE [Verrucomicrobiae bacterium]|nr:LPS assembly lipoprotein LptE [Verrucomicrobiae bacterium]
MRVLRFLAGCLALMLATGCAYRLGPVNGIAAGEKSVQLNPFSNQTMEPRLGDAVTTALRRQIQTDGTYKIATRGGADIIVTGVLTRYDRHELSFLPNDVLTVRDFRVSVTAHVVARDVKAGKVLFDQDVKGDALVRVGSDLTSSERQLLPVLADDLAGKITELLVDGSW